MDTLTNETTVYPSIREAARGIGYHVTSIRRAIKQLKVKGAAASQQPLIKSRYRVLTEEHLKINNSTTVQGLVEVFDILNNETTVYSSISEAAQAIGCVNSTI